MSVPHHRPQPTCGFPKYGPKSFSGGQIPDQNFNVTYGGGEFATGVVGLESVGLGGVTVKDQKMSLVNETFWESAGNLTSGLIGT
jgi:aspergillopepsin I